MSASKLVASVPEPVSLGEELLDQAVAFRPIREEEVETPLGSSLATIAHVVSVDHDGRTVDRGELPIFWMVIRDQLRRQSSPEVPWVAGVMVKTGRAYRLRPLTEAQRRVVEKAITDLPE